MLAGKARLRARCGNERKAGQVPRRSSPLLPRTLAGLCSTAERRRSRGRAMTTNPFALFDSWFAEARASEPNDSNAMTLATATPDGRPSVRMVLLKGHGPDGFVFYTNLDSRKGSELAENRQVALLFHWKSLRRQIRIEGPAEPVADNIADAYFATRSRDSQ